MKPNECTAGISSTCRYRRPAKNRVKPEPVKEQFEPANSTNNPVVTKAIQRYYKLHCGNVLDLETKTILNRDALLKILD